MLELRRELGDRFEHFQSLDSFEKSSYVLGSEAWEEYSSGLLGLIKDFVLSVWEERKVRLYGEHTNVHQSHSQNDSGDLRGVAGGDGELGCLCGKAGTSHLCDGSTHSSGCVVNGSNYDYAARVIKYYFSILSSRIVYGMDISPCLPILWGLPHITVFPQSGKVCGLFANERCACLHYYYKDGNTHVRCPCIAYTAIVCDDDGN